MNYVLLLKIMKDIYLGQLEKRIIGLTFVTIVILTQKQQLTDLQQCDTQRKLCAIFEVYERYRYIVQSKMFSIYVA